MAIGLLLKSSNRKYPYVIRQYDMSYLTSKIDSIRGNTIYFKDSQGYNVSVTGNYSLTIRKND